MFLCLIPKIKKENVSSKFRPKSLCNVIFKFVTKTIANHLKLIIPNFIDVSQSAFDTFLYMREKTAKKKDLLVIS